MANIGTFTAQNGGFTGTLRTLTLNVKVELVSNEKGSENAPDYRLQVVGGAEIGAAWRPVRQIVPTYRWSSTTPRFRPRSTLACWKVRTSTR